MTPPWLNRALTLLGASVTVRADYAATCQRIVKPGAAVGRNRPKIYPFAGSVSVLSPSLWLLATKGLRLRRNEFGTDDLASAAPV